MNHVDHPLLDSLASGFLVADEGRGGETKKIQKRQKGETGGQVSLRDWLSTILINHFHRWFSSGSTKESKSSKGTPKTPKTPKSSEKKEEVKESVKEKKEENKEKKNKESSKNK